MSWRYQVKVLLVIIALGWLGHVEAAMTVVGIDCMLTFLLQEARRQELKAGGSQ